MLKGYDDFGKRVKIVHFPLRQLLLSKRYGGCGAINWPYTTRSLNGWDPFKFKQF